MLVALNFCLKFPVFLKHSQKFLGIFQIYSFSGKVIGALSWNSQTFPGIPSPLGYKPKNFWEFLGIFGNFQVLRARVIIVENSRNFQEFPVRIYRENSHLLLLIRRDILSDRICVCNGQLSKTLGRQEGERAHTQREVLIQGISIIHGSLHSLKEYQTCTMFQTAKLWLFITMKTNQSVIITYYNSSSNCYCLFFLFLLCCAQIPVH